jgi:hypothetical protein
MNDLKFLMVDISGGGYDYFQVNTEAQTTTMEDRWIPSGNETWKFETSDGYLGSAYWRTAGAVLAVTRPDGTDLFRKRWSSREIFPAAWPGMFDWLKGQIQERVTADRALRAASPGE